MYFASLREIMRDLEDICIHQNLETGPIAAAISENKQWVHARENPYERNNNI